MEKKNDLQSCDEDEQILTNIILVKSQNMSLLPLCSF